MPSPDERWQDEEAGPVVRPYALIRGRTRPTGEKVDLIAMITYTRREPAEPWNLDPEQLTMLRLSRIPISLADLSSELDLPVGVVRILLADLRDLGLVRVYHPPSSPVRHDPQILKEVADGLRRL
jgi:Protein of unknown function (DUF742)